MSFTIVRRRTTAWRRAPTLVRANSNTVAPVAADPQDIDPSDMTHIANCLGLIRRAVLVVGLVSSSSVHFRAQAGPRTVCFPPNWAGIVAGITEDRDLVTLHGRGLFSAELGHGGGRYYS